MICKIMGFRSMLRATIKKDDVMKALVCREFQSLDHLTVEDRPRPTPEKGQVLIAVKAASVNFPDALIVQGKYQFKPALPFTPGSECSGVITALGPGVSRLKEGMRVLAVMPSGAFAEEILAHETEVIPLPPDQDWVSAAAMPMTYGTCLHALKDRAQLQKGETLLVLGAGGGIGLAAVELGKLMGATVIAAASSAEKLEAAQSRGAVHLIDYSREDLRARLKEITGDKGVDVVCDPVGGTLTEAALRSTAWGGRYLVVGFAAGDIPKIPLNLALLKGCSIVGVFWGEFMKRQPREALAEMNQLLQWLAQGAIKPLVSKTFDLQHAGAALEAVYTRQVTGKAVIVPSLTM
jgi:NADPH2:quinone reductase